MDFGKAFGFVTQDPDWIKKLAIGGVITLLSALILPAFLLLGYQIAMARNVYDGIDDRMPEWSDWGRLFKDGLYFFVGNLVYALPIVLLSVCFGASSFLFADGGGDSETIFVGIAILFACLTTLFSIALAFLSPAILIQYIRRNGDFGSLFRFSEVIGIARENLVDILLALVANFGAGLALSLIVSISIITICGPFILPLVGGVWISVAVGHLYGQIAAKDSGKKVAEGFA